MSSTLVEPEVTLCWSDEAPLSERDVDVLLKRFGDFLPQPPSDRADLGDYAAKLLKLADLAVLRVGGHPAAFLALYANDLAGKLAHIPMLAVDPSWRGRGFGKTLMSRALARARSKGMLAVDLEVDAANRTAVRLYERFSFSAVGSPGPKLRMRASLHGAGLDTAETPIESMEGACRHYLKSAEPENLPNASVVSKQVICLPIYPALTDCDMDRLVAVVRGIAVK